MTKTTSKNGRKNGKKALTKKSVNKLIDRKLKVISEPNYAVAELYGNVSQAGILTSDDIEPGIGGTTGLITSNLPNIPRNVATGGGYLYGYRETDNVHLSGIRLTGCCVLEPTLQYARFRIYVCMAKIPVGVAQGNLSENQIMSVLAPPDNYNFPLRPSNGTDATTPQSIQLQRRQIASQFKILKTYNYTVKNTILHNQTTAGTGGGVNYLIAIQNRRYFDEYLKFKNPINVSYENNSDNAYKNSIFIAIRSMSNNVNAPDDPAITLKAFFYYRDDL